MNNLKFIGNYKEWIQPKWINFFQSTQGQARPPSCPVDKYHTEVYQKAADSGYDMTAVHFWYFKHTDVPFDIVPPWLTSKNYYWWMVKMLPAQYMNMHQDPDVDKNVIRYWMPWTDYEVGHVFIVNGELITNYKAGDVFAYADQAAYHGSSNIGYTPRFVLQVTEFIE
jgi:hypothetical protein